MLQILHQKSSFVKIQKTKHNIIYGDVGVINPTDLLTDDEFRHIIFKTTDPIAYAEVIYCTYGPRTGQYIGPFKKWEDALSRSFIEQELSGNTEFWNVCTRAIKLK